MRINQLIHPRPYQVTEAYSDKNEAILQISKEAYIVKKGHIKRLSD